MINRLQLNGSFEPGVRDNGGGCVLCRLLWLRGELVFMRVGEIKC